MRKSKPTPKLRRVPREMAQSPAAVRGVDGGALLLPGSPNAGLVLLAPFFPPLFQRLRLLEGGSFRDSAAAQRAVLLLHFLATGEDRATDRALVLPKILAGLEPAQTVPLVFTPSDDEAAAISSLLGAALAQWPGLSTTSVAGFRETFLRRPGTLVSSELAWKLTVERRALDVLLSTIPWSFSVVKHSWMPAAVSTHWA